jgi:hypothetical protein
MSLPCVLLTKEGESPHKQTSIILRDLVTKTCDETQDRWYQEFCKEYGSDLFQAAGAVKSRQECLDILGWCSDRAKFVLYKNMKLQQKREIVEKAEFMGECIKMNLLEIFAIFGEQEKQENRKISLEQKDKMHADTMCALYDEVEVLVSKNHPCVQCKTKYFQMNKCAQCENVYYCNRGCKDYHFDTFPHKLCLFHNFARASD